MLAARVLSKSTVALTPRQAQHSYHIAADPARRALEGAPGPGWIVSISAAGSFIFGGIMTLVSSRMISDWHRDEI
jgi:hypothetical protein